MTSEAVVFSLGVIWDEMVHMETYYRRVEDVMDLKCKRMLM
jgi:hypothetical protein